MIYRLIRPLLFRLEPERVHQLTLLTLRLVQGFPPALWLLALLYALPEKPVQAFGLRFKNPVGLAAGYDKDALAVAGLSALGFGHIEIGTVTPLPQPGNPKPRLFRLVEDEAVINRMGFPSRGSAYVQKRLQKYFVPDPQRPAYRRSAFLSDTILGVNIGKNRQTRDDKAVFDYLSLVQDFAPYADYIAINVSSPNTTGLRALQRRAALERLLAQVHSQRLIEERRLRKRLPLLVKLAPDLSPAELDEALEVILRTGMNGVIAVNTTVERPGLRSPLRGENGGLSGRPLRVQSEAVLRQVVQRLGGQIPVISVGGIMSPEDAQRRLDMGADLVQVYTGLVYHGPGLVRQIVSRVTVR